MTILRSPLLSAWGPFHYMLSSIGYMRVLLSYPDFADNPALTVADAHHIDAAYKRCDIS